MRDMETSGSWPSAANDASTAKFLSGKNQLLLKQHTKRVRGLEPYRRCVCFDRRAALRSTHKSKMDLGFRRWQCYFQFWVVLRIWLGHCTNRLAVRSKNAIFNLVEGKGETSNDVAYGVEKL